MVSSHHIPRTTMGSLHMCSVIERATHGNTRERVTDDQFIHLRCISLLACEGRLLQLYKLVDMYIVLSFHPQHAGKARCCFYLLELANRLFSCFPFSPSYTPPGLVYVFCERCNEKMWK